MLIRLALSGLIAVLLIVLPFRASPPSAGRRIHHLCTLIAKPGNAFTYVPPPDLPPLARDGGANISVTYAGFTAAAQAAFQRAVEIASGLVFSPMPIRVTAEYDTLGPGELGGARATQSIANFTNAPFPSTWYPDALADGMAGRDIFPNPAWEIEAQLNSTTNWYFGTDGRPAAGQYDFVSVALHELLHGLGFAGFGTVEGGVGRVTDDSNGFPGIYDRFTVSESGLSLLTGFTSPSAALATQLQHNYSASNPRGPGVYWNGTQGKAANGGLSARLYTVSPWREGSSYSHLDESTYPAGHADSLMTFAISGAEAIHHPGNVTLGMFADMGWSTCPASLSASGVNVASGAASKTVALTIWPGCAWTATSQSSFLTVTGGAAGTGSGTVTFSVAANTTGSSRQGTLRISGATHTVTQSANPNTIALSSSTLNYAAVNTNGALSPLTPAQRVTVNTSGSGTITWSASANQPWVEITGGSGTGAGSFTIGIINPGNVLVGASTVSAPVTVTATNAGNSPQTLTVNLTITQAAALVAAIGQVDTPAQGVTGVQGAIPVTGWAVDDVGLASVKVYRNCLVFENQAACQIVGGRNVVFLADAQFVPGARPDLEAAFPTYPASHIAGWGMQVLSNMLPHVTNSQPFGGQGSLELLVFATDLDGHVTLLGRHQNDHTPTSITMNNDGIAKPFGAIDTPTQGGTVSGTFPNFGWVLTPDSNTMADATDILMATNGLSMRLFIDGAAVGTMVYNHCRGSVGTPVPAGLYCNDDVSNIFGHATPQPTLTTRTSNATRFRNLDAGRGPIGVFDINTSGLTNGMHSIAWGVTDTANRSEGIGSRNFFVLNSGADRREAMRQWGNGAMGQWGNAHQSPDCLIASLPHCLIAPWLSRTVRGRSGFSLETPFVEVVADDAGDRFVQMNELGRVELQLGAGVAKGYLFANGTLRDLPVGSQLDPATGTFTWAPAAGFLGAYRLVFVPGARGSGVQGPGQNELVAHFPTTDAREMSDGLILPVTVTVRPMTSGPSGDSEIRMHVDSPAADAVATGPLTIAGWSLDPHAFTGSGIGAVHVWARRLDVPTLGPEFVGTASLGVSRPDVAAAFGAAHHGAGFALTARLDTGVYDLTVYVWNHRTARWEDARTTRVTVR